MILVFILWVLWRFFSRKPLYISFLLAFSVFSFYIAFIHLRSSFFPSITIVCLHTFISLTSTNSFILDFLWSFSIQNLISFLNLSILETPLYVFVLSLILLIFSCLSFISIVLWFFNFVVQNHWKQESEIHGRAAHSRRVWLAYPHHKRW